MRFVHCVVFGLVFAIVGCGPRVAPVSGKITLDDKPLVNAMIIFEPDGDPKNPGPSSQGKTDSKGEYALQLTTQSTKGAIVGKHRVRITAYEGDDGTVPGSAPDSVFRKALLPEKYHAKSELSFDVPSGGTTEAN